MGTGAAGSGEADLSRGVDNDSCGDTTSGPTRCTGDLHTGASGGESEGVVVGDGIVADVDVVVRKPRGEPEGILAEEPIESGAVVPSPVVVQAGC